MITIVYYENKQIIIITKRRLRIKDVIRTLKLIDAKRVV